ncbi:thiamine-phosphate kinase [Spirosoma gilvum]
MYSEEALLSLYKRLHQRSPNQYNAVNETDAELIRLPGAIAQSGDSVNNWLALTTDTVVEEIQLGLLRKPYTIGWFAVMATLSDLAAVGALPIGLLMTYQLTAKLSDEDIEQLIQGVEDCARRHETYVLGGDTNQADLFSVSATALGATSDGRFSRRVGCRAGERVYVTPDVGRGNLMAFLNRFNHSLAEPVEASFRPVASLALGQWVARSGSACLDASDGLLSGLALLLTLNPAIGLRIESEHIPYSDIVRQVATEMSIPLAVFALGQVGDYGLLFTAAKEECPLGAVCLGEVIETPGLWVNGQPFDYQQALQQLNVPQLPDAYVQKLVALSHRFGS